MHRRYYLVRPHCQPGFPDIWTFLYISVSFSVGFCTFGVLIWTLSYAPGEQCRRKSVPAEQAKRFRHRWRRRRRERGCRGELRCATAPLSFPSHCCSLPFSNLPLPFSLPFSLPGSLHRLSHCFFLDLPPPFLASLAAWFLSPPSVVCSIVLTVHSAMFNPPFVLQ